LRLGAGASALALLSACSTFDFGDSSATGPGATAAPASGGAPTAGRSFGTGATKVALLLPLSGDAQLAAVGTSMANAAQLAVEYVSGNAKIGDHITMLLLDTGATAGGAAAQASAALAAGAKLILGPLRADQVAAAGGVASAAKVPLIGFSNNPAVAAPGVYLLNVLPDSEMSRSLAYAKSKGVAKAMAGIFASGESGDAQRAAFQQVASRLGAGIHGTYTFGSDGEMKTVIDQLAPILKARNIDSIVMPDRASAPALANAIQRVGVARSSLTLIGSADWDGDRAILSTGYLNGAIYPAVDDTGYKALAPEYSARFGGTPHPFATIAYTAAILANATPLVSAHYSAAALTTPGGFNGRDGVFRFLPDGRSQYALIIKQISGGTAVRVEGPKL